MDEECELCKGERVREIRVCVSGCRPWRHEEACPVTRKVPCPMCEKRELGEDLNA